MNNKNKLFGVICIIFLIFSIPVFSDDSFTLKDINKTPSDVRSNTFITLFTGTMSYKGLFSENLYMGGISGEMYFSDRFFSTEINFELLKINDSFMLYYGVSIYLHPFKNNNFDLFFGIGVVNGYSGNYRISDIPATVGVNFWISNGFAIKTTLKTYMRDTGALEYNAGIMFSI